MDIILFNPLSKNGKAIETVINLETDLQRQGNEVKTMNILDISDIDGFISTLNKEDRVIIVGGDGTLHSLCNTIYDKKITNDIYLFGAGTGNDFLRSLKTKKKLINITEHIKKLPKVTLNGKEHRFLNGVGIGLDGLVCYKVNTSIEEKNSWNYFKNTVRAFMESKKIKVVDLEVDGVKMTYKNVWLTSFMNGQYFGGGMKIAPKARRQNRELKLVLVKRIPKFLFIFILPTVYLGIHRFLPGIVKTITIKENAKVKFSSNGYLQMDGETEYPVREMEVNLWEED